MRKNPRILHNYPPRFKNAWIESPGMPKLRAVQPPPVLSGSIVRFLLAFKVMLFTVLVPGSVTLYFPYTLISHGGANLQASGLAATLAASLCILCGVALYLRCAWDFAVFGLGTPAPIDPPRQLVVSGPYRWTRNPMYQGVLLILCAEVLLYPSQGLAIYVTSLALLFHCFVVFYEEPALASRFGEDYGNYCHQVPRWGFSLRHYLC